MPDPPAAETRCLPRLALTMGDAAGIGPEVIVRACLDERLWQWCRPVVIGHPHVLERAVRLVAEGRSPVPAPRIASVPEIGSVPRGQAAPGDPAAGPISIPCWNPGDNAAATVPPGQVAAAAGEAAYRYLLGAAEAALCGEIDGLVTAPLNKAALHLAGHRDPGHTEILARACGADRFAMMLYLPPGPPLRSPHGLGVAHVTLHTSIASVPGLLSAAAIRDKIGLIDRFLADLGCPRPRIGVCALNPHAGEDGLFGDEEARIIAPAVREAGTAGLDAAGPLPADTLLKRAVAGEFDGVVAMYHDQGHIALKLIGCERAVNVTLGLPIVRTSPSHGTAFDIAWTGQARPDGLLEAVRVASLLARNRRRPPEGAEGRRPTGMER